MNKKRDYDGVSTANMTKTCRSKNGGKPKLIEWVYGQSLLGNKET